MDAASRDDLPSDDTASEDSSGLENEQPLTEATSFDDEETYHPIFCLTDVPGEYFASLREADEDGEAPWIEVTTRDGSRIIDDLRKNAVIGGQNAKPFLGWTVPQVYDFFKAHVRPPDDSTNLAPFSYFTFVVIDESCLKADAAECIICCDAPDYGEGTEEVKLKTVRVPLTEYTNITALEQLSMTPSELNDGSEMCLSMMPPPTMVALDDDITKQGQMRVATPAEARTNKRNGIKVAEDHAC